MKIIIYIYLEIIFFEIYPGNLSGWTILKTILPLKPRWDVLERILEERHFLEIPVSGEDVEVKVLFLKYHNNDMEGKTFRNNFAYYYNVSF